MTIHSKLFIQTTLIISFVLILGAVAYLKSIDAVFDNKTSQDTSYDSIKIQNYLASIESNLKKVTDEISTKEDIQASINLISMYEDKSNYQGVIFDNEKINILQMLDKWISYNSQYSISIYNIEGTLIAQKGFTSKNFTTGFISYDENQNMVFVSNDSKTIFNQEKYITKDCIGQIKNDFEDGHYKFCYTSEIKTHNKVIGYMKLDYWFGLNDLKYLNENLIYKVYFQTATNQVILPKELNLETINSNVLTNKDEIIKTLVYEGTQELFVNHIIDKSFIEKEKKSILTQLALLGIILIILSYTISWYFSKYLIINPLNALKDAIESIKINKYKKIKYQKNDELGKILKEFNELFEKFSNNYASLDSYKKAIDTANIVSTTDLSGRITFVNEQFLQISGYTYDEVINKPHHIVRHPDTPQNTFKQLWTTIKSGKVWRGIIKNKTKDGGYYWTDAVISPIVDSDGNTKEYISIRRDITELMEQKEKIQYIADFDTLTNLGTRNKLQRDLNNMDNTALAVINIDRFSQINDFYGHNFGDIVLQEFSKKLQTISTKVFINDILLYRLSADEFVLLDSQQKKNEFLTNLQIVLENLEKENLLIGDEEVDINVSCGVSFESSTSALLTADMALKVSKKEQKTFIVYNSENSLNQIYQNNLKWTKKLKEAINDDKIVPFFQPIINNKTLKLEKYESLIRMIDVDGKVVTPFFFLDIAKQTKQYAKLTKIMLSKSFQTFASKEEEFSINLSVQDILNKELQQYIMELLEKYDGIGSRVVFEIVESESIASYDDVISFIDMVKQKGCKIAIDDFGTGYSNFEYLIKLKADFIKIDGSLIKDIATNHSSYVVVSVIVKFAKEMGIKTVAEFVENKEILEILQKLEVDYSQGYFFSPPIQNI
ncbi:GGDEF domain-containing phosphodiesterase [Arcobacter sp. FWKO B]|uniref:bifunctional diguanylate cyclase/phosphodiesterase n=1 Tax=Arcobacter sp. FWKO B TaxID=2593672 RepID=UPI0018A4263C|nr:GGDEF domain-containing phosphodiesterase [Arcobacter sp. FWKO B]QOG12530.1 EAL domain-containing protein [Arcobacter sp. FWKO B]